MGLDGVEIILATEERFRVRIEDEETETMGTVGDLYRYLLRKLDIRVRGCPKAALFYRTRRALCGHTGRSRAEVGPATKLEALLPPRPELWLRLEDSLLLTLPPLWKAWWSRRLGYHALFATVGGLVECLWAEHRDRLAGENDASVLVWCGLRSIVAEQLGLPSWMSPSMPGG